jgi:transcriptional regulator with XRE-family HTH domain
MNRIGSQDGAKIRALRKQRGLSVPGFAELIGITPQALSNIELGNKPAGISTLISIARELGVPVDDLIRDDAGTGEPAAKAAAL